MAERRTYHAPAGGENLALFFRYEQANAQTEYLPHSHPWGQVIFVRDNVLEMRVNGQRLLTPAGYPVWIPPGLEHASYNHRQAWFRTFNMQSALCAGMPAHPCLLNVSPIVTAIVDDCAAQNLLTPLDAEQERLCRVLCDQLKRAVPQESYLPTSDDKLLAPVLKALEANPADNTTLAQWARRVYSTERTLARRCQAQLGMGFSEWRQRLRFLHAIALLEQGRSVQDVAHELGYSSPSALIVMFQQQAGTTPERFRARSQRADNPPITRG